MAKVKEASAAMERRAARDRRDKKPERRQQAVPVAVERRQVERRKVPRRRQIDPTTCERDYTDAEVEFMNALDDYKRRSGRMFPTCSEILEVVRALGYQKQCASQPEATASPGEPTPGLAPLRMDLPAGAQN